MRKSLSALIIVTIFALSIIGALSGISHTHGGKTDHAPHKACPICQFNQLNPNGNSAIFGIIVFLVYIFCIINYYSDNFNLSNKPSIKFFSSRAPPLPI